MHGILKFRMIGFDGQTQKIALKIDGLKRIQLDQSTLGADIGLAVDCTQAGVFIFSQDPSLEFLHNGAKGIRFQIEQGDWVESQGIQLEILELPIIGMNESGITGPALDQTRFVTATGTKDDTPSLGNYRARQDDGATQAIMRMSVPQRPNITNTQTDSRAAYGRFKVRVKPQWVAAGATGCALLFTITHYINKPIQVAATPAPEAPAIQAAIVNTPEPGVAPMPTFSINKEPKIPEDASMARDSFFDSIRSGDLSLVKKLVAARAVDPNLTLDHGMSALHVAAMRGQADIVKYLLSKRANVNARDPEGATPLMWAVFKKQEDIIKILVKAKTDLSLRREDGDRAIDIAKRYALKKYFGILDPNQSSSRSIASTKRQKNGGHSSKKKKKPHR